MDWICDGCDKEATSLQHYGEGKLCSSCDAEYARDGSYQCSICSEWANQQTSTEDMKGMCFTCAYWQRYIDLKDKQNEVIVGGVHYRCNTDKPIDNINPQWNGFGGRRWHIRFFDGRDVITNNLWYQGQIPERFRELLPDNAEFGEV